MTMVLSSRCSATAMRFLSGLPATAMTSRRRSISRICPRAPLRWPCSLRTPMLPAARLCTGCWGVDPGQSSLGEGNVPAGAAQGRNDFGTQRYGGPCPPRGRPHRYVFNVFALSKPLDLAEGASAADLKRATAGKVLASASLTGRYGRR